MSKIMSSNNSMVHKYKKKNYIGIPMTSKFIIINCLLISMSNQKETNKVGTEISRVLWGKGGQK